MLEICIQTSYDQNVQLILKSYLPVVYGTILRRAQTNEEGYHNSSDYWISNSTDINNKKPCIFAFTQTPHTFTKMNDNINMYNTISGVSE
jgi:hypothetical protein